MADLGTGNDHRVGRMLLPVAACEKCVEISKTAECVAVHVRPSFDKNKKCMTGEDNSLSYTRHTLFIFARILDGHEPIKHTHSAVL